jgi:nucleoside 2-deoxyribosyltransferase
MQVVYSDDPIPTSVKKTIFLAGPTPRSADVKSWRPEALRILEQLGYDGHVFVPEWKNPGQMPANFTYEDQVEWETQGLNMADVIVFWVPRNLTDMPAFTTNVEFGMWADSGKAVFGYPPGAEKNRYLEDLAKSKHIPVALTLEETLAHALTKIGVGAERTGGESQVPILIWNHSTFQKWYESQKAVGNRIDYARVLWNFRVGKNKDFVFCFALHVKMWVHAEQRLKWNEIGIFRTDVSSIALFYKPHDSTSILDTEVLLVKEFRTPVRNPEGFVFELPGGSSKTNNEQSFVVVTEELKEETSFCIDPSRIQYVESLQVMSTLLPHTCTLFSCAITKNERNELLNLQRSGKTFGVASDTEITYPVIISIRDMFDKKLVDWSTLGMIFSAIKRS